MSESSGAPPSFDLLTIDTQAVKQAGYGFDRGLLAQLRQFKGRKKRIVLSEVVVREIVNQLAELLRTARSKLETARKELEKTGLLGEQLAHAIDETLDQDLFGEAKRRVGAFIEEIGAEVVSSHVVSGDQLAEAYFNVSAPFGFKADKKYEFPDALALFSLEAFARKHSLRILAVSKDTGWAAYGNKSSRIKVIGELSEALALAQDHLRGEIQEEKQREIVRSATTLVERFLSELDEDTESDSYVTLCTLIEDQLKEGGIGAETSGVVEAELDLLEVEIVRATISKATDGRYSFRLVHAYPGAISISLDVEIELRAHGHFSLYGYDSIDKDAFSLGSQTASGEFRRELSILLNLVSGPKTSDVLTPERIEILSEIAPLDFGDVIPDWGPEHDP